MRESTEGESAAVIVELLQDLAAVDAYAEKHGSFADLVRDHYELLAGSSDAP
jgi:hypothetical protein